MMWRAILLFVLLYSQTACNLRAVPSPIASPSTTPTITIAPPPTATATSLPTQTPTPTPTFTPTPTPTTLLWAGGLTPLPPILAPLTTVNASQVSGLAAWYADSFSDMTWSPDGEMLVVASASSITFYDPLSRQSLRSLHPKSQPVIDIDFSPTGAWLVAASRRGSEEKGYISKLELWQSPDWKPRGVLFDVPLALSSVSFSSDGSAFAAAYSSPIAERNSIDFWNVTYWQITETFQTGPILNIGFSPDGDLLAVSPDRYALRVMDLHEKTWLYTLSSSFTGAVSAFCFSPDGLTLASGHYDGMIRLWDMRTGELFIEMQSEELIQSLAFSPDGQLLASGGSYENSLVRLWDSTTGALLRTLEGHTNGVSSLLFSPSGNLLVSASYDGTLRIWGLRP